MDKLKRVLSGNDDASDENRGIMGDVRVIFIGKNINCNNFKLSSFSLFHLFIISTVFVMETI